MDTTPGHVKTIWILYLVSVVVGLTAIVGVVLAYIWRKNEADHPMATHYARQIRTFWIAFGLALIGLVLTLVGVGVLIMIGAGVYFVVMSVLGLVKALDEKPWP